MYDELIDELRLESVNMHYAKADCELFAKAADAIEELSKKYLASEVDNINLTGWLAEEHAKHLWIPVTERLPTIDQEVIVLAYGNMMRIWNLHRLDPETADVCWECEDGTLDDVCVVTHWMPLPEPPKEES